MSRLYKSTLLWKQMGINSTSAGCTLPFSFHAKEQTWAHLICWHSQYIQLWWSTNSGTCFGEVISVIWWKIKLVTEIPYMCYAFAWRSHWNKYFEQNILNWRGVHTWPSRSRKHVYWERGNVQMLLISFFSVQINNVYVFLSWRKTEIVKIAHKWESCYSLPCSWNHDSHYITKKKIAWNKQHKLIGLISSKNIISQSILWQKAPSICGSSSASLLNRDLAMCLKLIPQAFPWKHIDAESLDHLFQELRVHSKVRAQPKWVLGNNSDLDISPYWYFWGLIIWAFGRGRV